MTINWIDITDQLPQNQQLVIAYLPCNFVPKPGNPTDVDLKAIKILKFEENFYGPHKAKHKNNEGVHFWSGEGLSNHFFQEVSHWMPLPNFPK